MASSQVPAVRRPPWGTWGDRLLAASAVGLALSVLWWWVGSSYLDLPLSSYLSGGASDLPFLIIPHELTPILGPHYFGDFQESRTWGQDILNGLSPYRAINIYPPLAPWIMVPFAALPLTPAFVLYALVTAAALVIPTWLLLRNVGVSQRLLIVALLGAATAPFLSTLDRGNLQGITIGLVGFSLVALQRSRIRWACALVALAIAIKPFVVVIALAALVRRRPRFALMTIALAAVLSTIAWLLLPGSPVDSFAGILLSQMTAAAGPDFADPWRVWGNMGMHGLLGNLGLLVPGASIGAATPGLGTALSLAWLALVGVVAWRRRVPQWVWGLLVLSSLQVAQPYAAMYTASWATLGAVWYGIGVLLPVGLVGSDDEKTDRWVTALRAIALAALVVTLTPLALRPEIADHVVPVQQILSPALWSAMGLVALVASFLRRCELPAAVPEG